MSKTVAVNRENGTYFEKQTCDGLCRLQVSLQKVNRSLHDIVLDKGFGVKLFYSVAGTDNERVLFLHGFKAIWVSIIPFTSPPHRYLECKYTPQDKNKFCKKSISKLTSFILDRGSIYIYPM